MLPIFQDVFPVITSKCLLFRELLDTDVDEVLGLRSDPEVMKYIPRPLSTTKAEALENIHLIRSNYEKNEAINWAICQKNQNQLIGIIGFYRTQHENFRSELGYMLSPDYQNKGYISEAIKTVLAYAFQHLNMHSVNAVIDPNNIPSEKVLVKNGFRKEAHFVQDLFWRNQFLDSAHYGILKSEFEALKM